MALRFSPYIRNACLQALADGTSISTIAAASGVSRTTLYTWSREVSPKMSKTHTSTHWKHVSDAKARKIITCANRYPSYTISRLSDSTGFSRSFVWKTLRSNHIYRTPGKAGPRKERKPTRILASYQKYQLMEWYTEGEGITELCKTFGISRTTFYNLAQVYFSLQAKDRMRAFEKVDTSGSNHYRYITGAEEVILHYTTKHPEMSHRKMAMTVKKEVLVSASYVYSVWRRHNLHTKNKRRAYVSSQKSIGTHRSKVLGDGMSEYKDVIFQQFFQGFIVPFGVTGILLFIMLMHYAAFKKHDTEVYISTVKNTVVKKSLLLSTTMKALEKDFMAEVEGATLDTSGAWGAVAVNTQKAMYTSGEKIALGVSILDERGMGKCYAPMSVSITDPQGHIHTYDSGEIRIVHSTSCGAATVTDKPDYSITLPDVTQEGRYTASILHKGQRATTHFYIAKAVPVSIERFGAIRVWPLTTYQMKVRISSHTAFIGEIKERVPKAFAIVPGDGYTVETIGDSHVLTWQVHLKPGEVVERGYLFDAPDRSPMSFHLEPLQLVDTQGRVIVREPRAWQFAIDGL